MTLSLPFDLPETLVAVDFGELVTRSMAKLCRMHAISGRHGHVQPARTLNPGLALKPINRDRMNQPKPLLTFQGNHRLPFHCEPGTPFRMVYARQQLAKAAGRMGNLLLETWRMLL